MLISFLRPQKLTAAMIKFYYQKSLAISMLRIEYYCANIFRFKNGFLLYDNLFVTGFNRNKSRIIIKLEYARNRSEIQKLNKLSKYLFK
jgi:hypothetical protein